MFVRRNLDNPQFLITFTHNDLLSGNVLYDNTPPEKVMFIDLEYGGFNYSAYDVANHFCEYQGFEVDESKFPTCSQQTVFVHTYLKEFHKQTNQPSPTQEQEEQLFNAIQLFGPVADLFWGTWALLQAHLSSIEEFDYLEYGIKRWQRYYKLKPSVYQKFLN